MGKKRDQADLIDRGSLPNRGQLRVWWVPQVPMKSFYVEVQNLREAKLLLGTLAEYDKFQFDNRVKPDYANAGGLQAYYSEDGEWIDWYDSEGRKIDEIDPSEYESAKWEMDE